MLCAAVSCWASPPRAADQKRQHEYGEKNPFHGRPSAAGASSGRFLKSNTWTRRLYESATQMRSWASMHRAVGATELPGCGPLLAKIHQHPALAVEDLHVFKLGIDHINVAQRIGGDPLGLAK